jgi:hypothetical protein
MRSAIALTQNILLAAQDLVNKVHPESEADLTGPDVLAVATILALASLKVAVDSPTFYDPEDE